MKVWEETWTADSGRVYLDDASSYRVAVFDRRDPDVRSADLVDQDYAAARLASAAPDMARQLLALEWGGAHLMAMCPQCQGLQRNGHHRDCELAAAFRKAGVR